MFERCVFIIHNDTELHSAAQALKRSNCIPPQLRSAPLRCAAPPPRSSAPSVREACTHCEEITSRLITLIGKVTWQLWISRQNAENKQWFFNFFFFFFRFGKEPAHKWIGALPWQSRAVTWRIKEIDELSGLVLIKNQSHMQKLAGIPGDIQLIICLFLALIRGP